MSDEHGVDALAGVTERTALDDAALGNSSARLERVVLADGRRRLLKHLPPEGDWLTRATAGNGRMRRLWDSGVLAQVETTVDHAVEAVVTSKGADVVVMRDVSAVLLPPGSIVSTTEASRLLAGLAAFHAAGEGCELGGLCRPAARYAMFAPRRHAADDGPGLHPARDFIVTGWETFADLVPGDGEAVFAVHANPEPLGDALRHRHPRHWSTATPSSRTWGSTARASWPSTGVS